MDQRILRSIIASTQDVFKTMVFQEIHEGEASEQANPQHRYDLSGVIGLSGPASGAVCVHFSKELAAEVASSMLGQPVAADSEDTRQTVSELTNMIAGGMRNELSKDSVEFDISIPTVISGSDHRTEMRVEAASLSVPFNHKSGTFVVEACIAIK